MKYAVLICLLTVFTKCLGQTTWQAASSPALWNNPVNWSTGIVPGPTTDVVFSGVSSANCILDIAPTVRSISINGYTGTIDMNGNSWTISSAVNVTDRFATGTITNSSATASTLTVIANGSALAQIIFSGTLFQAGVNITASGGQLLLDGSTFNGTCSFMKTRNGVSNCTGGNTFNGPTTVGVGPNSGELNLTGTNPDVFNSTVTLIGASSSIFRIAYGAQCTFNGNITLTNTTGTDSYPLGISFGNGAGTGGSSVLAAGSTVSTSAPSYSGVVMMDRFTQNGTAGSVNLTMSVSTGHLYINNSLFNGNVTASGRALTLQNSTFSGTTNLFSSRASLVGMNSIANFCTFGVVGVPSTTTFERTTSIASDFSVGAGTYNSNVVFVYSGGGATCRVLADGLICNGGDLSWNNNSTGDMNLGNISFNGSTNQTISRTAGNASFVDIRVTKTGTGNVTINTPIVTGNLQFNDGIIFSSSPANFVQLNTWGGILGSNRHIDGPVRKVGSSAFTFPTGNNGMSGAIAITAPTSASTFEARFIRSSALTMDSDLGPGLVRVSNCEYWTLDRPAGTGNVDVSLSWGLPSSSTCLVGNTSELRVAQYDGSKWVDRGNNVPSISGGNSAGSIRSSAGSITSFAFNQFALSSSTVNNTLPIELISFDGESHSDGMHLTWKTASELDNDYFEIERSNGESEFISLGSVPARSPSKVVQDYEYIDQHPLAGSNYYRLKQVDLDGTATYFQIIHVDVEKNNKLTIYPNPVVRSGKISISEKGNFRVMNSLGRVVMHVKQSDEFEATDLTPGVFTLIGDDGKSIRFIVK